MMYEEILSGQVLKDLEPGTVVGKGKAPRGVRGADNTGIVIDPAMLGKHILAMGAIGSGKSNLIYHLIRGVVLNGLTSDDVVIFFDAKGDYLQEFYRPGDYVIGNRKRISPDKEVCYWNIFEDILVTDVDERNETVREVGTSIFKKHIDNSQNPGFAMGARDIFCALLMAFMREAEKTGRKYDNHFLKAAFNSANARVIKEKLNAHADLSWATSYIMSENSPTTQSYISPLFTVAQEMFVGSFAAKGNFSMRRAVQEKGGKSVFLEYDVASGNTLEAIYTVLIDLAMKEALGQGKPKGNVYFILDEFPLIPKLNYMDNALNFGRSLGVKVIAGIQNVGQVENTYTPPLAHSLLSGFGTMFAFRLFDEKSRKLISDRHGKNRKRISMVATAAYKGMNEQMHEGNAVEDWDITKLGVGQCIASIANDEPFRFYPVLY
jgi:type IV secretory pathway TraG/TraD family ATPase VirD4